MAELKVRRCGRVALTLNRVGLEMATHHLPGRQVLYVLCLLANIEYWQWSARLDGEGSSGLGLEVARVRNVGVEAIS